MTVVYWRFPEISCTERLLISVKRKGTERAFIIIINCFSVQQNNYNNYIVSRK